MYRLTSLVFLLFSVNAAATCPEFLNHDLRKLHSQDTVNLCEVAAGKPLLIVNTASHCGYTSQFTGLEKLHEAYKDRGLVVLASPAMISARKPRTNLKPPPSTRLGRFVEREGSSGEYARRLSGGCLWSWECGMGYRYFQNTPKH